MVGLVTPPNQIGAPARRVIVCLRESHSISKVLNFWTWIGASTSLPAGWLVAGRSTVAVLTLVQRKTCDSSMGGGKTKVTLPLPQWAEGWETGLLTKTT